MVLKAEKDVWGPTAFTEHGHGAEQAQSLSKPWSGYMPTLAFVSGLYAAKREHCRMFCLCPAGIIAWSSVFCITDLPSHSPLQVHGEEGSMSPIPTYKRGPEEQELEPLMSNVARSARRKRLWDSSFKLQTFP